MPDGFSILEFEPAPDRLLWTYATSGMFAGGRRAIELHLRSPLQSAGLIELLTVVAHYHSTAASLGVGHTVNFGRPWLPGSLCSFGLVSLPYLDGPSLECYSAANGTSVQCLWLIPITGSEVALKKKEGLDALEAVFERSGIDFADPFRPDLAVRH